MHDAKCFVFFKRCFIFQLSNSVLKIAKFISAVINKVQHRPEAAEAPAAAYVSAAQARLTEDSKLSQTGLLPLHPRLILGGSVRGRRPNVLSESLLKVLPPPHEMHSCS